MNHSVFYGRQVLSGVADYVRERTAWELSLHDRQWLGSASGFDWRALGADGMLVEVGGPGQAEAVLASGLPAVDVADVVERELLPRVCSDGEAAGRLAAEHLLERELRRFAYVGLADHAGSRRRARGLAERVREAGLPAPAVLEVPSLTGHEVGELTRWLAALPARTGVLALGDLLGTQVVMAARRLGRAVPDDLAVVGGEDDHPVCRLGPVPLSSVRMPLRRIGWIAADLLGRLMEGEPAPQRAVRVPPAGLTVRQSSDMWAVDDVPVATALRFMRDHLHRPISVDDIAAATGVKRRTLEYRFRRRMGRTLVQELTRARLARARRLLVETDQPVARIAEACGFRTASYLTAVFSRHVGEPPAHYRRRAQRGLGFSS